MDARLHGAGLPHRIRLRRRALHGVFPEARDHRADHPAQLPEEGLPRRVAQQGGPVDGGAVRGGRRRDLPGLRGRQAPHRRRQGRGCLDRRHGYRQERRPQVELPTGNGNPRQGHRARRGRARESEQTARRAIRSGRRKPAGLRDRDQRDLEGATGEAQARPRHPRLVLPGVLLPVQRHVALRHEGQPRLLRLRDPARLGEPAQRSAPGGAEVQDPSLHARSARRRRAGPVRREGDPDGGPLGATQTLL